MPEGRYGLNAGEVSVVTGDGRLKLGWWAREVVRLGVVVDVDSRLLRCRLRLSGVA